VCKHYSECGGCTTQHATEDFIRGWKLNKIKSYLLARKIKTNIKPVITSLNETRRRATFHGLKTKKDVIVGFFRKKTHELVSTDSCKLVDSQIISRFGLYRKLTKIGASRKSILKISTTVSRTGLDINITDGKPLNVELKLKVAKLCSEFKVARITWNTELIAQFSAPVINFNGIAVKIIPETFLQATEQGEETLIKNVISSISNANNVIDLFSGCGTFSLPASRTAKILAVDKSESMLSTIDMAWRNNIGLKEIRCRSQDLFKEPILEDELDLFDAAIIDPPRLGAEKQTKALARSKITRVSSVSCDPKTFSRDAEILIKSGFKLDWIQPIDQFLWSSHIELVSQFSRQN
jgi:23S rRNA (uracil1939-C5)-methyltransferase